VSAGVVVTEGEVIAIITAMGGILAAAIATASTVLVHHSRRTTRAFGRITRLEHRERLWWMYTRSLLDHIYRGLGPPPPEPPEGLFDLDEGED
jgi:hypothetical protein